MLFQIVKISLNDKGSTFRILYIPKEVHISINSNNSLYNPNF